MFRVEGQPAAPRPYTLAGRAARSGIDSRTHPHQRQHKWQHRVRNNMMMSIGATAAMQHLAGAGTAAAPSASALETEQRVDMRANAALQRRLDAGVAAAAAES